MKTKKIEVIIEFLIFGIVVGVIEDLIAVSLIGGERITFKIIGLVILLSIPFAILGEIFADRVDFTKVINKWRPKG